MAFGTPWTKELRLNPAVSQRGGFFKQVSSTWCFSVRTEEGSNVTLPTPPALHGCVWQKPREVSKDALLFWQYSPSKDFFTFKLCLMLSWKGTLGLSTLWSQSPKLSKAIKIWAALPPTPVTSCASLLQPKYPNSSMQALHASRSGVFGILKTSFSCVLCWGLKKFGITCRLLRPEP